MALTLSVNYETIKMQPVLTDGLHETIKPMCVQSVLTDWLY